MQLRFALASVILIAACHSSSQMMTNPDVDAPAHGSGSGSADDAPATGSDAPVMHGDGALAGFGTLSGTGCGAITAADLVAGSAPKIFHITFDFARQYVDPDERPLLTAGGQVMAATPNAGGTSGFSEMFSFEELDRCDGAMLLKTETEIAYEPNSKKTDLEISIQNVKIGVSVTRAFTYPLGTPYTLQAATDLLNRKLGDIQKSSAGVLPQDAWAKQFLSVHAFDADAAALVEQAWAGLDPSVQADTDILLIETDGADDFIYTNQ